MPTDYKGAQGLSREGKPRYWERLKQPFSTLCRLQDTATGRWWAAACLRDVLIVTCVALNCPIAGSDKGTVILYGNFKASGRLSTLAMVTQITRDKASESDHLNPDYPL